MSMTPEHTEKTHALSDQSVDVRPLDMTKIDRMDDRGWFREHLTRDGKRTLCGLSLSPGYTQNACGNRECRRCEKIAARCQIRPPCGVVKAEP